MVSKPHWLSMTAWLDLLGKYDGIPRCAVTGDLDDLSVDHIVPRRLGGTDDVSNLQFLKIRLNCAKGDRPDTYWEREFWFDKQPDMAFARTAQADAYNEILRCSAWFSQPMSVISRLLYIFPWIVGAGKTLNMLTSACAINAVIGERWGSTRRADCLLVLAKEQGIRDQLATDLEKDSVRYGLFHSPPRVTVVKEGWRFGERSNIDQFDVVVACIQQLWEMPHLEQLLHKFPLIHIDEPHWAVQQVRRIVDAATTSLCFGSTGTPIEYSGELLQRMIAVTIHGYDDADSGDRSMKYLHLKEKERFIRELKIDQAELLVQGTVKTVTEISDDYEKNIEPAKAVVDDVIQEMNNRDSLRIEHEPYADHRQGLDVTVGIHYPTHPMIVTDSVPFAQMLCEHANRKFEENRALYPREKGWNATIVHAEGEEPDGTKRLPQPFIQAHPWLRYSKTKKLDTNCSRLLFVVGMGREGMNNPYCGPIGLATIKHSIVEHVQRAIGRQIRSIIERPTEHDLIVPPMMLDSVLIITHEAFGLREVLTEAIDWVMRMPEKLAGLPTVETLIQGETIPNALKVKQDDILLPPEKKIGIAAILGGGGGDIDGWSIDGGDDDIEKFYGGTNPTARAKVREWIDMLRKDPAGARRKLGFDIQLSAVDTVMKEDFKYQPSDDELVGFLRIHFPDCSNCNLTHEQERRMALNLYAERKKRFRTVMSSTRNIDQIRKTIAGRIFQRLGRHLKGDKRRVFELVAVATKKILGIPSNEKAAIGSRWDIPQTHALVLNPELTRKMISWATGRLINEGFCPSLVALRDGEDDADDLIHETA